MTIGPEPMIRMECRSVRFGKQNSALVGRTSIYDKRRRKAIALEIASAACSGLAMTGHCERSLRSNPALKVAQNWSIMPAMKRQMTPGRAPRKRVLQDLPLFCDFSCPHAAFAPADATGACRREQGVYCTLLRAFNNKNSPCKARRRG